MRLEINLWQAGLPGQDEKSKPYLRRASPPKTGRREDWLASKLAGGSDNTGPGNPWGTARALTKVEKPVRLETV